MGKKDGAFSASGPYLHHAITMLDVIAVMAGKRTGAEAFYNDEHAQRVEAFSAAAIILQNGDHSPEAFDAFDNAASLYFQHMHDAMYQLTQQDADAAMNFRNLYENEAHGVVRQQRHLLPMEAVEAIQGLLDRAHIPIDLRNPPERLFGYAVGLLGKAYVRACKDGVQEPAEREGAQSPINLDEVRELLPPHVRRLVAHRTGEGRDAPAR